MKILALDLSTKTGWALLDNGNLEDYGQIKVEVINFNVNNYPNLAKEYPYNIVDAANEMADKVHSLVLCYSPDFIAIENTVRGKNRHTQRILEFLHKSVLDELREYSNKIKYLDPSEWRGIIGVRMSNEDKKHNKMVSKGLAKGKLTRKHICVKVINEMYSLDLKIKDNDIADAIGLGTALKELKC